MVLELVHSLVGGCMKSREALHVVCYVVYWFGCLIVAGWWRRLYHLSLMGVLTRSHHAAACLEAVCGVDVREQRLADLFLDFNDVGL